MKVTREIFYFKLSAGRRAAAVAVARLRTARPSLSLSFFLSVRLCRPFAIRETSYIAIIPEKEEAILPRSSATRTAALIHHESPARSLARRKRMTFHRRQTQNADAMTVG